MGQAARLSGMTGSCTFNPAIVLEGFAMRFAAAIAFILVCTIAGGVPADAATKIKISYSFVYDRIRPEPQKNVRVTSTLDVALSESGAVKEDVIRTAGRFSDGFKTGTKLGGGQWEVVSEKQLRRAFDQPQSTLVLTISVDDDKKCTLDMKWTLKPEFSEFKFRRITDGTTAFFTEPKVRSTTCSIQ
jgi:hypothetical protein